MGYKIITKEEYESNGWHTSHPNARCSSDGKEYVLSNVGSMTKSQVAKYIAENWPEPEEGEN